MDKPSWSYWHKLLAYLFGILAFAAIISGIYYWQTVANLPTSYVPIVHKDPTANWKTHTNTQYGFEFKYPENLNQIQNKYVLFSASSTTLPLIVGGVLPSDGVAEKDWTTKGYEIHVTTENKSSVDTSILIKAGYTQFNGYVVDIQKVPEAAGQPEVLITDPQFPERYIVIGYNSNQNYYSVFNQILTTFKFTN